MKYLYQENTLKLKALLIYELKLLSSPEVKWNIKEFTEHNHENVTFGDTSDNSKHSKVRNANT